MGEEVDTVVTEGVMGQVQSLFFIQSFGLSVSTIQKSVIFNYVIIYFV